MKQETGVRVFAAVRWRLCAAALAALAAVVPAAEGAQRGVRVVVTGVSGGRAEAAVEYAGGRVIRRLPVIDGLVGEVPARA